MTDGASGDADTGKLKLTAGKSVGFYVRVAKSMLEGSQGTVEAVRKPVARVELDALGNAISVAGSVAAALEHQGLGSIGRIETDQVDINGKGVPKILVEVVAGSRDLSVNVVGYSVLGSKMTVGGQMVQDAASPPDANTAFVDPAGLSFIQEMGPGMAGGAAGAIYSFLGIRNDDAFPQPVRDAVKKATDAKFHTYGQRKCVHVVGPNFGEMDHCTRQDAVALLASAYKNILAEFAGSGLQTLRLLPVSGGIFAGPFTPELPQITAEALRKGFSDLPKGLQDKVLKNKLEMCIFMEKEFKSFVEAFAA